jgi:hypothetical protein
MGWGEWCRRPVRQQRPRSGKVNSLNKTKLIRSTDFKLLIQKEIRQVIVLFKFLISVRVGAPGVKEPSNATGNKFGISDRDVSLYISSPHCLFSVWTTGSSVHGM